MIQGKLPLIAMSGLTLFLALAVVQLYLTGPADVAWLPVHNIVQKSTTEKPPVMNEPALNSFEAAWRQPLFSTDRKPDPEMQKVAVNGLDGMTLVGVFSGGGTQIALLRQQNGQTLRLHVGQRLESGWILSKISGDRATFGANGQMRDITLHRLTLPVDADQNKPRVPKLGIVINEVDPSVTRSN